MPFFFWLFAFVNLVYGIEHNLIYNIVFTDLKCKITTRNLYYITVLYIIWRENFVLINCHKCDLEGLIDTKVEEYLPFVLMTLLYIWMNSFHSSPQKSPESIISSSDEIQGTHQARVALNTFLFVIIEKTSLAHEKARSKFELDVTFSKNGEFFSPHYMQV